MGDKKIPVAVLKIASRQAKVISRHHEVPTPDADEARDGEQLRTRRQLVREKIVTGLRKLHPMD